MATLQNSAISEPRIDYVVAFVAWGTYRWSAARRTIHVLAATPKHAKRICKQRYPRSGCHDIVSASPLLDAMV